MGDLSVYLVQIDSGKMVQVTLPNTVRQINRRLSWDETVWLSWDASSPVILPQ
jgi:putrescine transport system ATP-binding protein